MPSLSCAALCGWSVLVAHVLEVGQLELLVCLRGVTPLGASTPPSIRKCKPRPAHLQKFCFLSLYLKRMVGLQPNISLTQACICRGLHVRCVVVPVCRYTLNAWRCYRPPSSKHWCPPCNSVWGPLATTRSHRHAFDCFTGECRCAAPGYPALCTAQRAVHAQRVPRSLFEESLPSRATTALAEAMLTVPLHV